MRGLRDILAGAIAKRAAFLLVGLVFGATAITVGLLYHFDMSTIRSQLAAAAEVSRTSLGTIAFESGGVGTPVLAIHGAGGGHDQGRLLAEAFLPEGYSWIAPSRFGYPGSPLPSNASTAAQADIFAALLDDLHIQSVIVLAMSGGVPPALQFALRHPERVDALVLLSLAPYAPLTAVEQDFPVPLWFYEMLFASDLPFWAILRVSPSPLAPIFDARNDVLDQITAREAAFLDAMIRAFLPATSRRAGLGNEGAAIDMAGTIDAGAIHSPVLILHANDDRITPVSTATFTGARIAGAEVHVFDSGGHLLLGRHDAARAHISRFLAQFASNTDPYLTNPLPEPREP